MAKKAAQKQDEPQVEEQAPGDMIVPVTQSFLDTLLACALLSHAMIVTAIQRQAINDWQVKNMGLELGLLECIEATEEHVKANVVPEVGMTIIRSTARLNEVVARFNADEPEDDEQEAA